MRQKKKERLFFKYLHFLFMLKKKQGSFINLYIYIYIIYRKKDMIRKVNEYFNGYNFDIIYIILVGIVLSLIK